MAGYTKKEISQNIKDAWLEFRPMQRFTVADIGTREYEDAELEQAAACEALTILAEYFGVKIEGLNK